MNPFYIPVTEPVGVFAIVAAAVFIAPLIASRIGLPPIIGLLFAGMIIGPNASGLITMDRGIEMMAAIGLIYLMFTAGIEMDMVQFRRKKRYSLIFGLLTFLIPFIAGTAAAYGILKMDIAGSILLASMFSSHTLLTYPAVSVMGLSKQMSVVTAVGGTLFTNLLAMFILAVITGSRMPETGWIFWITLSGFSLLFSFGVLLIVPYLGRYFFRIVNADEISEYIFVIAVLFFCAWLSYAAGLEPIIGAFQAGIALNRLIPDKSGLMNRIRFIGNSLFIPVFLLSVGMLFNPAIIFQSERAVLVSVVMIFIALITKYIAARLSGFILKFNIDETNLLFGLTVNQAAATLAGVIVGYRLGLFDDAIVTGTISMILVTSFVGSWFTGHAAKKISAAIDRGELPEEYSPQRILITVSNAATASELMNLAFLIRDGGSEEPVFPVNIVNSGDAADVSIARSEKILAPAVVQAVSSGVPVVPITRTDMNVISGIKKAVTDLRISDIITGWSGVNYLSSAFSGEVPEKIVKQTAKMVMICRITARLNITDRLLIVLPPLAAQHIGFKKFLRAVFKLARQLSAQPLIFNAGNSPVKSSEIIKDTGASYGSTERTFRDMSSLLDSLNREIGSGDIIVLFCFREDDSGWTPTVQRLPGKTASQFPENTLIAAYPSKFIEKTDLLPGISARAEKYNISFSEEKFADDTDISLAVSTVIRKGFNENSAYLITEEILRVLAEEPVQLMDGLILLHCHSQHTESSRIFTGCTENHFSNIPGGIKIKAFILLIAPIDQPPEVHLGLLASIVRAVRTDNFINRVMGGKTDNM